MEVKAAEYLTSSPSVGESPPPDRPEIAFIGRSNVGKSSLINMLCNNRALAKVSGTPGKTRLLNFFEVAFVSNAQTRRESNWYWVDLPGYGFARASQSDRRRWQQMIEGYIRKRPNLLNLFVLIDSRHHPQQIDLDFIATLGKWNIPFSIVFTKADKNKAASTVANVNSFLEALEASWARPPVFFVTSAITKEGKSEILAHLGELAGGA